MEVSVSLGSDVGGGGLVEGHSVQSSKCGKCIGSTKKYFINRLPILKWFPKYKWKDVLPDAVAGLSVGLTAIPQSMAYAGIAGLTPEYGLYSSFISCFVYIFLGSCRQMTIGPTAVIELLTFETCGHNFPSCVILTGFYAGAIQLIMGILQLGTIVSLISEPVTIAFVAGAALTISSSQIKSFLGLVGPKGNGFLGYWKAIINNISTINLGDALMGIVSVILLYILKNVREWTKSYIRTEGEGPLGRTLWFLAISRNALILIITSTVAFSWTVPPPFALTGKVKGGFPPVGPPNFVFPVNSTTLPTLDNSYDISDERMSFWETWAELGTGPLTVAFISILQNVAIAKAFGSGQSIDANQEMISLGISHLTSSFFSAMPTSGSFSRSAINEASGVRSPISGLFTGLLVIFALGFLTPSFYYIPKASLAAVILSAVLPMIEYQTIIPMWRVNKMDSFAATVTFFCSLFLGMEYGILIGVGTSLGLYLIRSLRPKIESRILTNDESIVGENTIHPEIIRKDCLIIKPDQGFGFPSVDYIRSYINESIFKYPECKVFALDCQNMVSLDYTAATALAALAKGLKKTGKSLVFMNCKPDWIDIFKAVGFIDPNCLRGKNDLDDLLTEVTNSTESTSSK